MKLSLEFDPLNREEVEEAHAILLLMAGERGIELTGADTKVVNVANITNTPENRKEPTAEEKAASDKAIADKAKAEAAAKNKADAAAAAAKAKEKADAEAKEKADADAKAAEEAKVAEDAKAAEDDDSFLDGSGEEAPTYTIEDVRTALKAYSAKHTKVDAIKILKDNGAATIGDLAVDKYAAVMAAAKVED